MNDLDRYQLRDAMPPILREAFKSYGIKEITGKGSNPKILEMAKVCGVDNIYKDDDTAWCALFICFVLKSLNYPMPFKQYECLRAKSFLKWGDPISKADMKRGDIVVFDRPGGAHVAILVAETEKTVAVLGGNQSNMVNITEISKDRIAGVRRWYPNKNMPDSAKKYVVSSSGKVSINEA